MPPRPFPFQLNIGTDISHCKRFYYLIQRGDRQSQQVNLFRLLRQFLTAREQEAFVSRHKSVEAILEAVNGKDRRPVDYLAGRWAAKEATIKAVKHRSLTFRDVQILTRSHGRVYALILDKPASTIWPDQPSSELPASVATEGDINKDSSIFQHADPVAEDEVDKNRKTACVDNSNELALTPFHLQTDDLPGQIAKISISHDGEYATAVCLAAEEPHAGDVGGEGAAREP